MKTCVSCNTPLELGSFAYNQELCWDCFKEKAEFLISNTPKGPDRDILNFLLNVTIYTFIQR